MQESNGVCSKQDSEVDVDELSLEPKQQHHLNTMIIDQDDDSSSSCENKMIILHDESV